MQVIGSIRQFLVRILNQRALKPKEASQDLRQVVPDETLAVIVGPGPLLHAEVITKVWSYIVKHKLQDPKDRRLIRADETLRPLFDGQDSVSLFQLNQYLRQHLRVME